MIRGLMAAAIGAGLTAAMTACTTVALKDYGNVGPVQIVASDDEDPVYWFGTLACSGHLRTIAGTVVGSISAGGTYHVTGVPDEDRDGEQFATDCHVGAPVPTPVPLADTVRSLEARVAQLEALVGDLQAMSGTSSGGTVTGQGGSIEAPTVDPGPPTPILPHGPTQAAPVPQSWPEQGWPEQDLNGSVTMTACPEFGGDVTIFVNPGEACPGLPRPTP